MAPEKNTLDTSLKITREFAAPVERVFAAWTDPKQMVQWMGPGEVGCKDVQIDPKVGGKYLIHMVSNDGDHVAIGEYKEIIPQRRLQFTWSWKSGTVIDSLVTVEFEDNQGSTRLTLTHENFPDKDAAEKHTMGWNGCLDGLDKFIKA